MSYTIYNNVRLDPHPTLGQWGMFNHMMESASFDALRNVAQSPSPDIYYEDGTLIYEGELQPYTPAVVGHTTSSTLVLPVSWYEQNYILSRSVSPPSEISPGSYLWNQGIQNPYHDFAVVQITFAPYHLDPSFVPTYSREGLRFHGCSGIDFSLCPNNAFSLRINPWYFYPHRSYWTNQVLGNEDPPYGSSNLARVYDLANQKPSPYECVANLMEYQATYTPTTDPIYSRLGAVWSHNSNELITIQYQDYPQPGPLWPPSGTYLYLTKRPTVSGSGEDAITTSYAYDIEITAAQFQQPLANAFNGS